MFSKDFIEKVYEKVSKESNFSSLEFSYGPIDFLVTKKPLQEDGNNIFQGHLGEGESLLFIYLQ